MTADLREAMALAPWAPATVKKEEEEEENFLGQASSQQMHSEDVKVWAPGEDPQRGLGVTEQEEKVLRPRTHNYWFQKLKYVTKQKKPT
uniref:Zinc finger protein 35 n=1 Tax=Molossus molossus TaxID=27622 RepID=A0A7J8DEY2_MOLMO|nr:zinc finger protein 35 [Molossus molossus]